MMTEAMSDQFRVLNQRYKADGYGAIAAKRTALRLMLEERRQKLVDYLEGRHYGETHARAAFGRLHAECTLILIAIETCQ